jgi:DedD protein
MMERRVKERLIGATLLVALIVLVVPEMLSGPRQPSAPPLTAGLPAPTRSVSVDLATSKAIAESDLSEGASAASPPGDAASPGAAGEGASAASAPMTRNEGASDSAPGAPAERSAPESPPTVTTLKAQPSSGSTLETPASPPKSAPGGPAAADQGRRGWAVQLGSFASRANADRLIHQLQARGGGWSLYVSASGSGPSLRYRVRVGPLADRGAAERAAGKLKAAGHPATVVTPSS